jgi:DNA-binding MarR family transcriptional regulator
MGTKKALESGLAESLRGIYRGLDLFHDALLQLSPKELAFLLVLDETGPCRVKALAKRLTLPLSTVSWTADRMVGKGLLSRKTDPDDRRAVLLDLAASGRKAIRKHRKIFDDVAKVVVARLSPKESKQALALIEKVSTFFKSE